MSTTTDKPTTRSQVLLTAVRGAVTGTFHAVVAWLLEHYAGS